MKHIISLMLLWFCNALPGYCSAIDSIMTKEDLNRFMVTRVDTELANVQLTPIWTVDTSICPANSFYKADINGDGLTDLVINSVGGWLFFCITDEGNGKYKVHTAPRGQQRGVQVADQRGPLVNLLCRDKKVLLVTREELRINDTLISVGTNDTLIYRLGSLITYNPNPDTFAIAHIKIDVDELLFSTIYVDLDSSGKLVYNFSTDENDKRLTVSRNDFKAICATVNYLGFSHYREHFTRDCDDCGLLNLTVTYCNGKVKKIEDYGMQGTAGLITLYHQMYALCPREY